MNDKFSFKNFAKLPQKQKQACYIIAGSILFFVVVVIASTVLLFAGEKNPTDAPAQSGASSDINAPKTDAEYKKEDGLLDLQKLKGTVLEESGAKDAAYLTDTVFVGDSKSERLYMYQFISLNNFCGFRRN